MMRGESRYLGEGFYWMAEKLMWGYDNVQADRPEALRLYRQSADLGVSDAHIRIGEAHEFGKGVEKDPTTAFLSYQRAAEAGNFLGFAYMAKLLSRTKEPDKASVLWERFFRHLEREPEPEFLAEKPGALVHTYLEIQLRGGKQPHHVEVIRHHREAVIGYHQHLLQYVTSVERLDGLQLVHDWMVQNFEQG
jgi:TPR repeat protein